jgi:hypothetical protein
MTKLLQGFPLHRVSFLNTPKRLYIEGLHFIQASHSKMNFIILKQSSQNEKIFALLKYVFLFCLKTTHKKNST